jgi:amino acid adenylation domain-containing protein
VFDLSRPVSYRGLLGRRRLDPDAEHWLSLAVRVAPDRLRLEVDDPAGWDAERLIRFEALPVLLADAVRRPDLPVTELSLLGTGESERVLREWNDTAREYPIDRTAAHLFERHARQTPYSIAVAGPVSMSYAELNAAANRLARWLVRMGVGPGDLVGLNLGRGADALVSVLAVWKAGAAYVPLDPAYPPERLRFMVDDSGASLILTEPARADICPAPGRRRVVLDAGTRRLIDQEDPADRTGPANADRAYVIYTSGSTGTPKGVEVGHASLTNLLLGIADVVGLDAGDGLLAVTSLSFDIAILELLAPLVTGGRVILAGEEECRDGRLLAELLATSGATVMQATPATWRMLLAASPKLPPVTALCGGEPMPPSLARRLVSAVGALWNVYGPTETTVWSTAARIRAGEAERPPVGRPLPNSTAYVLDGGLRPVPVGAVGELCIGGAGVARGYWKRPELTRERFRPDPFRPEDGARLFRTGDLARYRDDGTIEVLGRRDHQVKLFGHRVELGEVESVLAALPGVDQAVAVVRAAPDSAPDSATDLVAFVATSDPAVAPQALRAELGQRLPAYMIPTRIHVQEPMPVLPNGKVDRGALQELAERGMAGTGAPVPAVVRPLTGLESAVAAVWTELLGTPVTDPQDNFFGRGGTSLRAGQLVNVLSRSTAAGETLYVRAVFDHPTLSGFCAYLEREYPVLAERLAGTRSASGNGRSGGAAPAATRGRTVDAAMSRRFRQIVTGPAPTGTDEPQLERAAFVLSAPRSGSTLLRVMLAGHPRLFVPPELELLGFDSMSARARAFAGSHRYAGEGLVRAVRQVLGGDVEQAHELVAEFERGGSVAEMYGFLQRQTGGRLLIDKTSTYATDTAALRRAELLFDEPRYIHLVRHPAGMIHSFTGARLDQVFRHEHPFTPRELAELTWLTAVDNVTGFLAGIPAHRHVTVRFEDLVRDPASVLGLLADFLGVGFHPAMLQPYAEPVDRMVDGLHPESRMAGDPKFTTFDHVDPSTADSWRGYVDLGTLSPLTTATARHLGYPVARERPTVVRSAPLTTHQRSIYLHERVSGERTLYNICKAWRVQGEVNVPALRAAVQYVVDRHEALRTAVAVVDGEPRQEVRGDVVVPVELAALPAGSGPDEVRAALAEFGASPLHLDAGQVLRVRLISLDARDHALALLVHHAMVDGSSLAIVLSELSRAYAAACAGTLPDNPPPKQFLDVPPVSGGGEVGADLEFWRQALEGVPPLLPLPVDRARPARKGYRGGRVPVAFAGGEWAKVAQLARDEGATVFIVLLAAFKALMRRYTAVADLPGVVVGTAFVNRHHAEDNSAVGMFTGNLPLYTRIPGDPTFRELLAAVRDTCLAAYEHHRVSFDDLVRELGVARDASHSPLIQVLFAAEPADAQELRLPGLDVERLEVAWRTAKFDLTVSLVAQEGALGGWWEYDAELFDADQVRRMIGHHVRLLAQAAADPDRRISEYDLLDAAEADRVLRAWNDTRRAYPAAEPIETAIRRHAHLRPDATAVAAGPDVLTYAQLDATSDELAQRLVGLDVTADEVVAVLCPRTPAYAVGCLAALKSGAGYLPIDPATPPARITYLLADSAARAVLVTGATAGLVPDGVAAVEIRELGDGSRPAAAPPARKRDVEPTDLAYVIYTSGSTGQPKGVLVEHGNLENFVRWYVEEYQLGPDDRCSQTVNVGFDASVMELWPTLVAGASLHIAPARTLTDPAGMWDWLRQVGATVSFVVTPLIEAMLADGVPDGLSLRTVVTGGDRLHPQPALRDAPFRLVNGYGPTENTILSTTWTIDPADGADLPPIGRPVPNTTAYVLDGALRPVPIGVEGELYVGGAQVARGYLNRPELTAERFRSDPFATEPGARLYRTGDRARHRQDGAIEFLARMDDQVKIRGFRIELGEIEAVLRTVPGVPDAAVVASGDGNARRLDAFYATDGGPGGPDADPGPERLRETLRQHLPGYMVPAMFTRLDRLPLTANGKVDRSALVRRVATGLARVAVVEPRTPLEVRLLELWRRVLGTDQIGVADSFFERGGHSLNAMRLVSLIRKETGRQVNLATLFVAPTVRDLAAALAGPAITSAGPTVTAEPVAAGSPHVIALRAGGSRVPLVCVHASDGNALPYRPLPELCGPERPVWALQAEPVPDSGYDSIEEMAARYLAELRGAGVTGPVHLLGWSFGGVVAYEMARQLAATGSAPGRLGLLDSEPLTRLDSPDDTVALAEFGWQLGRRAGAVDFPHPPAEWPGLLREARTRGWVDPEVDEPELRHAFELFRSHMRLGWAYVPPPVDHPLHVYVATGRDPALRRAQVVAWTALTSAGASVVELPGDHFDAVSPDRLRTVAADLLGGAS